MAVILALLLWLSAAPAVNAATYQQCTASSTCTIGEWLYNDSYQPQNWAVCTLTAQYPDGSEFLSASASATADGWYYYDAAIGTTTGLYPANFCCTAGTDYLCLDKSFEVKAAASTLTAADVWSSSSRTLTGFGSLIADIWNNSTRSLTTFGDLVSNVWNYSTTTTTTPAAITNIVTEQAEQRELLEKLVNEPVVTLSLEEGESLPDLNSKLEQSLAQATALYEAVQGGQLNNPELLALTEAWEAPIILQLNLATSLKDRKLLAELIGTPEDESGTDTLFGFLAQISDRIDALKTEEQQLAQLLDDWSGQGEAVLEKGVTASRKRIIALNEYPGTDKLLRPAKVSSDAKVQLKNIVFSLQALLGLNRQLLAGRPGAPLRSLWLEEGSIIFRGVITNPSTVISQTVPLKFYLPRELKTEDVITLDPALETHYDTTEEALFVTGSFTLDPQETRLVFVEVEDVWRLTAEELNTLKKQAAELLRPLEKTSYFAQGTVLKSTVDVSLEKILLAQTRAVTPENRIRAFREAKLELNGVDANLARLQDLVAQASGTGSIFGFVGGVQAVAVWGILIIVIAGFVYLTIYMRRSPPPAAVPVRWDKPALVPLIVLATAIITVVVTQLVLKPRAAAPATVLELTEPSPSPRPSPSPLEIKVREEKQVLGVDTPRKLLVPPGGAVNIRSAPDQKAPVVLTVKSPLTVFVFDAQDDWARIGFSEAQTAASWWVSAQFLD